MKFAVIGAGIAGLTAGRELAKAGHQVDVFEEGTDFGGRLATYTGKNKDQKIDFGLPYFEPSSNEFEKFLEELKSKNLIAEWKGGFAKRVSDGSIIDVNKEIPYFIAAEGMNNIGKYLGRMLDIYFGEKVGGLTHIGANRTKKRTWMLNFPTAETKNFDAVVIATPARQAYAILNTTIDEIQTLTLVREIDEVKYSSQFTLLAGYGEVDKPEWNALECEDNEVISWISNESTKRENGGECVLVVHTTSEFAQENRNEDPNIIAEKIAAQLADIIGTGWAALPEWQQIHFWKYNEVINPLPHDYMEIKSTETPLALVGGYMKGNGIESAYLSGLKLGKYWVDKYNENTLHTENESVQVSKK
ncbi:MAG: FAD-dependent oxidoreductase [Balneolaceae bacterium]